LPATRYLLLALICATLNVSVAAAQNVTRVAPGWSVDTLQGPWIDAGWHARVPEIFRAWREYLLADAKLQNPSPRWSAAEQRMWPGYDLTASLAYHADATVLDIRPTAPGSDEYVVKTLFARAVGPQHDVRPVALTRVYAIREDGRWVFANALPRLTRDWPRTTIGAVTYVVSPARSLDRNRAARAIAFADSIAESLGLPKIEKLTYYVASNSEELQRVMGFDWTFGGYGSYSLPWNQLILSGDSAFAEAHRHELIHLVLSPITGERRTHSIINEGIATWLGGMLGRTYEQMRGEYASFIATRPEITLDLILATDQPDYGHNPAGAILVHMVHERGGMAAVKQLLRGGRSNDELRATLTRLLGIPWNEVLAQWHTRASSPSVR
jgi:hypothetical protein